MLYDLLNACETFEYSEDKEYDQAYYKKNK